MDVIISPGRDVIYVPGYYKEKKGKTRKKNAERAAHMAARAAPATPQPGTAAPKRETEELEGSNNSKLVEINAAMIEEEVTVEMGFQLRDSFNPKVNEELMPPNNAPIT